jgi:hypothetical protein
MIQNLVVLGNCLKTGSNHGTGAEWDCAPIARGCTSGGGTGIGACITTEADGYYLQPEERVLSFGHLRPVPRAFF